MNTSHLEKPLGPLQKYAYLLLRTNHSIKIGRFTIFNIYIQCNQKSQVISRQNKFLTQIYFHFRYFMRMIVKNFTCFIAILIFFAPSTCITGKSSQFSGTNVLQFNILTRSILKVAMNFTLST